MKSLFPRIGLFAKHNDTEVTATFKKLIKFLEKQGHHLILERQSATLLSIHSFEIKDRETLGKHCDLIIVIGGDGSFLNAARAIITYKIPILGINRGKLGFLADILPNTLESALAAILEGHYQEEKRFLLKATITREGNPIADGIALNDVVLYSDNVARMIEFEVYINDLFVLRQQADGIITATPTGSTAYALSAGGPILYPTLSAISLAPLNPHTLSSRPIVVEHCSKIKLIMTPYNEATSKLSCDGQLHFDLKSNDEILIQKYPIELTLIHPNDHEYFTVLREKLGWST